MRNIMPESKCVTIKNQLKICAPKSPHFLTTYILQEQENWFESEICFIDKFIKPGMSIIDIGANYGVYTLNFARLTTNKGNVIAFEPTSSTAQYLEKSIIKNGFSNITLHKFALSNFIGERNFYTNENSELNSLSSKNESSICTTIQVDTLDNMSTSSNFPTIDFIKLDAEGEENNIFDGAKIFLENNDPLIMFEYKNGNNNNNTLLENLRQQNYTILRHVPGLNILTKIDQEDSLDSFQLNLFCCKKEKLNKLIFEGLVTDENISQLSIPQQNIEHWENTLYSIFHPALFNHIKISSDPLANSSNETYLELINEYCLANKSILSASENFLLLKRIFLVLEQLIQTNPCLEYLLTFSRVSLDLGYRTLCLNTLSTIIEKYSVFEKAQQVIVFIPTVDADFQTPENRPLVESIYVKTLENIEKLQAYSSYFLHGKNFNNLEILIKLGSQDNEILRRYYLVSMQIKQLRSSDISPKICIHADDNLNPDFWTSLSMQKANSDDFKGRFREIMSDPNNHYIPKVENAGKITNNHITLHNGIKVNIGQQSYYGEFSNILILNQGVHEPQEERVFMEVLKYIPENSTMIELGSYWSFYSMWFQQSISNANNYMIEPDADNLEAGIQNFKLNSMKGDFTQGFIGDNGLNMDDFVNAKNIRKIDILHSDIQGAEFEMLQGSKEIIRKGLVKFIFISTHSQSLHYQCMDFLKAANFEIIASADFDNETYCYDGIIVAKQKGIIGPEPINLAVRNSQESLSLHY